MNPRKLLSPPVLRASTDAEEHRGASWLELFFDLVFVVAIAQMAVTLGNDLSAGGFLRFVLMFVSVWWSWAGYTNYADRFDTDDVVFRAMMLAGMLGIAAVAVSVPDAFAGGSEVFAISYIAVRVVLILLYARARRNVPVARDLITVTMAVFTVGVALWALSLLAPEPWRFVIWPLALLIEGATPWIARKAMASVPMHASHLPERYGLFIIIVLGESLVAVVVGVDGTDWRLASALVAAMGFLAAACLWWIYFDFIELADIQRGVLARNVFIYGHLLIALGLTVAGVGIKKAIQYSGESHLSISGLWMLCGGAALSLAGISLIYGVSTHEILRRILHARIGATMAALGLGGLGAFFPPVMVVGLLFLILLSLVVYETLGTGEAGPEPGTSHTKSG